MLLSHLSVGVPRPEVIPWPVGDTFAFAVVDTEPTPLVIPVITGALTIARATTVVWPTADVAPWPVGETFALAVTETEALRAVVACWPLGEAVALATTVTAPTPVVMPRPVTVTLALATTVGVPRAEVAPWPVGSTGIASFQAPWPQVPRPQPVILAI